MRQALHSIETRLDATLGTQLAERELPTMVEDEVELPS